MRWKIWLPAWAALLIVAIVGFGVFLEWSPEPSGGLALSATRCGLRRLAVSRGGKVGDNLHIELEAWGLPEPNGGWSTTRCGTPKRAAGASAAVPPPRQPNGFASASMSAPVSAVAYPEIEITLEPDDGDPGASGAVMLEGVAPRPRVRVIAILRRGLHVRFVVGCCSCPIVDRGRTVRP